MKSTCIDCRHFLNPRIELSTNKATQHNYILKRNCTKFAKLRKYRLFMSKSAETRSKHNRNKSSCNRCKKHYFEVVWTLKITKGYLCNRTQKHTKIIYLVFFLH